MNETNLITICSRRTGNPNWLAASHPNHSKSTYHFIISHQTQSEITQNHSAPNQSINQSIPYQSNQSHKIKRWKGSYFEKAKRPIDQRITKSYFYTQQSAGITFHGDGWYRLFAFARHSVYRRRSPKAVRWAEPLFLITNASGNAKHRAGQNIIPSIQPTVRFSRTHWSTQPTWPTCLRIGI